MAGICVVASSKGGVGKTSLSVHLVGRIRELDKDRPIICVDADPQEHSFKWLAECAPDVRVERCTDAEVLLRKLPIWGDSSDMEAEHEEDQPTRIVVDCFGGDSDLMRQAIGRADCVVIPVGASSLDLDAASSTWRTVQLIRDLRNDEHRPHVVFAPSRMTRTKVAEEVLEALAEYEEEILEHHIPQRAAIADAAGQSSLVWDLPGSREVADTMRAACDQILARVTPKPWVK